ncbi:MULTISPECIES: hypothetical protein [Sinorhizobium]|nr:MULTISPECIES: hypothetical protein [Sinorhizobium]
MSSSLSITIATTGATIWLLLLLMPFLSRFIAHEFRRRGYTAKD